MIVDVAYPAWCRYRPAGARRERDALVRVEGKVSLREVEAAALRPLGHFVETFSAYDRGLRQASPVPVVEHGGLSYVRVGRALPGGLMRPVSRDELLRYLANGHERGYAQLALDNAFVGTPLRELHGVASLSGKVAGERGEAVPDGRLDEAVHDGRAAAAAALQAFLDRELLVVGPEVYLRFRPYLRCLPGVGRGAPGEIHVSLDTSTVLGGPLPFSPRATDVARHCAKLPAATLVPGTEAALDLSPPEDDGEDVRRVVRFLAGMAARWVPENARRLPAGSEGRTELQRFAESFVPTHMLARIGGISDADYPEVARRVFTFLNRVANLSATGLSRGSDRAHASEYLYRVALPRLATLALVRDDDVEAIQGLAP